MEVKAILLDRNVFALGETLRCQITFSNPSNTVQNLGWASAQAHCSCTLSDVSAADEAALASNRSITSFRALPETGSQEIYASKPQILFADLELEGGTSKVFSFEERLPPKGLPPSYLGTRIKYSYKIIIGMQRINSSIRMLKIPFRVIKGIGRNPALPISASKPLPQVADNNNLDGKNVVSSPFLLPASNGYEEEDEEDEGLNVSDESFSSMRKSFHHYEIASKAGKLGKLSLFKNCIFRIGEEVIGSFEFYDRGIRCVEYSVSLMRYAGLSHEEILNSSKIGAPSVPPRKGMNISCHAKSHEVTLGYNFSNLSLQIPLHVSPTFETDYCQLKWYLHFVFVITSQFQSSYAKENGNKEEEDGEEETHDEWNGPHKLEVETMVWDLPITLYHTAPDVIASGLLHSASKRSVVCQI